MSYKQTVLLMSVFSLFLAFVTPVFALSPAPSAACCFQWGETGIRPDICEPKQTESTCEKELNTPEPNYLFSCWPNDNDPTCRANEDARVAKIRQERMRNPIDLNANGIINGKPTKILLRGMYFVGAAGLIIGIILSIGVTALKGRFKKK